MKVTVEIDVTPEEFKELLVPSDKQSDFMTTLYDAWAQAFKQMNWAMIDPQKENKR